jgi:hypothetical protein
MMSVCPITPDCLLNLEAELCRELITKIRGFPGEKFTLFQSKSHELESFIRKPHDNPLKSVVCFEAHDPRDKKIPWWVHLGVQLEQSLEDRSATYMMAIGTQNEDAFGHVSETLCKVHWDYEFAETPKEERKPERHMQFGGRVHTGLESYGYKPFWKKGMDKPRIPNLPVCFVTLIHWAFLEFAHCDHIAEVLMKPDWTDLVRQAEDRTLKPYFENATTFFARTANDRKNNKKSFFSAGYR